MNELATLELIIKAPAGVKLPQSAGSVLHGMLMEYVDKDYVESLHEQALRPYSQYLTFDREREALLWRISALNKQAMDEVLAPAFALPMSVHLKQKGWDLQILGKNYIRNTSYEKLAEKYFANELDVSAMEYRFITSCSFKTDGDYAIFPQPKLITKSLVNRWNAFASAEKLDERSVAYDLAEQVFVADYDLKMQKFALEGTRIQAFRGGYTLAFKGNLMSRKIMCMLGEFAQYSGIGIKTALGMGATKTNLIKW